MEGKIVKGIAGFYYVFCKNGKQYECKAKGGFRKDGKKPLVGDNVSIHILDDEKGLGNIEEILPRKNALIRPAVANVDQAMVVFAMASPMPNLNLLDRFLVMMECQQVDTVICFSKQDIVSAEDEQKIREIYRSCGKRVICFSNTEETGIGEIADCLKGATTVLAGPSGVGKSSLVNRIYPEAALETGEISEKIGRGKHTTRHSELFHIGVESFLFDTPGFSSLKLPEIPKEELCRYFTEFTPYEEECRFLGCSHIHEPGCAVKEELEKGVISRVRYRNYVQMYEELAESEKRNYGRNRK
jgi:ribosome biogenesis GTPase